MKLTLRFLKFKARTKLINFAFILKAVGVFLLLAQNVVAVNRFDLFRVGSSSALTGYSTSLVILLTVNAYHTLGEKVVLEQTPSTGSRSPRKLGYVSASIRTMGCLPKFFCALPAKDQTWNDLAHLIKFAMLNDDTSNNQHENNLENYFVPTPIPSSPIGLSSSSEEDSKEEEEDDDDLAVELQPNDEKTNDLQTPPLENISTTLSPKGKNLTKQEKYKQDEALVDEMLANLDQAIENTKLNNDANLSNILSGLNQMFRFGRSMNATGARAARTFWKKNNFRAQMTLAAKIRQQDVANDKHIQHCSSAFNLCPYTVQEMKYMIEKGREEAKLEADFLNQYPKPPPLPPPTPPVQYPTPPPLTPPPPTPIPSASNNQWVSPSNNNLLPSSQNFKMEKPPTRDIVSPPKYQEQLVMPNNQMSAGHANLQNHPIPPKNFHTPPLLGSDFRTQPPPNFQRPSQSDPPRPPMPELKMPPPTLRDQTRQPPHDFQRPHAPQNSLTDLVKSLVPKPINSNKGDGSDEQKSQNNPILRNFLSQSAAYFGKNQNQDEEQEREDEDENDSNSSNNFSSAEKHKVKNKDRGEPDTPRKQGKDDTRQSKALPKLDSNMKYTVRFKGKRSRRSSTEMEEEDDEEDDESWEYSEIKKMSSSSEEDNEPAPVPPTAEHTTKPSTKNENQDDQVNTSEEESDEVETPKSTPTTVRPSSRPSRPMVDHAFKEVEDEWQVSEENSSEEDDENVDDEKPKKKKKNKKPQQQSDSELQSSKVPSTQATTPPTIPTSTVKSLFNDLLSESNVLGKKYKKGEKPRPSWDKDGSKYQNNEQEQKQETTTASSLMASIFGRTRPGKLGAKRRKNSPFHLVIKHALTSDKVTNFVGQNVELAIPGSGSVENVGNAQTQHNEESLWKPPSPSHHNRGKRPRPPSAIDWQKHHIRPNSYEFEDPQIRPQTFGSSHKRRTRPSPQESKWDDHKAIDSKERYPSTAGDWTAQQVWNSQEAPTHTHAGYVPPPPLPLSSYDQSSSFNYYPYPYQQSYQLQSANSNNLYQQQHGPQQSLYQYQTPGPPTYTEPQLPQLQYQQPQTTQLRTSGPPPGPILDNYQQQQQQLMMPAHPFPPEAYPPAPFPYFRSDIESEDENAENEDPPSSKSKRIPSSQKSVSRRPKTRTDIDKPTLATFQRNTNQNNPTRTSKTQRLTTAVKQGSPNLEQRENYGYNQDTFHSIDSNNNLKHGGSYEVAYDEPDTISSLETSDWNIPSQRNTVPNSHQSVHYRQNSQADQSITSSRIELDSRPKQYSLTRHNVTPKYRQVITTTATPKPRRTTSVSYKLRTFSKPTSASTDGHLRQSQTSIVNHQRLRTVVASSRAPALQIPNSHKFQYQHTKNAYQKPAQNEHTNMLNTVRHYHPSQNVQQSTSNTVQTKAAKKSNPESSRSLAAGGTYAWFIHPASQSAPKRFSEKTYISSTTTQRTTRRPPFVQVRRPSYNTHSRNSDIQDRTDIASQNKNPYEDATIKEGGDDKRPLLMQQQQTLQLFLAQQLHHLAEQQLKIAQQMPMLSSKKQSRSSISNRNSG